MNSKTMLPLVLMLSIRAGLALDAPKPTVHRIIAGPAPTKVLADEIAALDQRLFNAIFNDCDTATLSTLLTGGFEFYHDRAGQTASTAKGFVEGIEGMCKRQREGIDYRANRQLVPGSMRVYPLNNYGAIEIGEHRFFSKAKDGSNGKLLEIAKFTHLWKKEEGGWKLAEVLSYDHKAAAETAD